MSSLIMGEAGSITPGVVWLHAVNTECMSKIKGIRLMMVVLREASAGILIENLTTMALLQKYIHTSPIVKIGVMR